LTRAYIVYYWWEYEGGKVVGVYTDFDKATEHLQKIKDRGDGRSIKEIQIGVEFELDL
jgi:hypothetical protein